MRSAVVVLIGSIVVAATGFAGERTLVSLRDFCGTELKAAGLDVKSQTRIHIKALGGGGDYGWTYKSDRLFAYGWIINAQTRDIVWKMDNANTSRTGSDRSYEGDLALDPGSYEVYFVTWGFAYHTTFTHLVNNVDRRKTPLFGPPGGKKEGIFNWFTGWWGEDVEKEWKERCGTWGIDLFVDDAERGNISTFVPPRQRRNIVLNAVRLGDNVVVRRGFSVSEPVTVRIDAEGETIGESELSDFGWIVNVGDRNRVWQMTRGNTSYAGGARRNVRYVGDVTLEKGEYVLMYVTDGAHSFADWADAPPYDPFGWGVSVSVGRDADVKKFKEVDVAEIQSPIVRLVKVGDNETKSEGFSLKESATLRIYAFGERANSRRQMADYATILDAKTRERVWSMTVERTMHAGGASKNRYVDELITLPRGSYIVQYVTDDTHSYPEWNDDPPFDPENYGITVMGWGPSFNNAVVGKYVEERNTDVIAQIVRVGDNADRSERFALDRNTRVRVYAIGEGQNRELFDYGWIENARTGAVVWEMTYSMTIHAGGGRKNRSVNTTILLERGEYLLRYRSDDSHSYGHWNVDPPDDPQYWGITLYREEGAESVVPVVPPPVAPPSPKPRTP